ncbi:MAG: hypothetical protein GKS07_01110 [Nitrosopumilus sp.]|nr:MAG: hypothetical protein GKS07_01110 [Nitrosopumilus sp.]
MKERSDEVVAFDKEVFGNKVHEQYLGYRGELQRTTDKKTELFIQLNYFQSCLEDSMEYLLKTDKSRDIPQGTIIRILFARGIITPTQAKNAMKINKIKNICAHNFHDPSFENKAKEKIDEVKPDFTGGYILYDGPHRPTLEQMQKYYDGWNMFEKLNFIIHDLILNIEFNVSNLED